MNNYKDMLYSMILSAPISDPKQAEQLYAAVLTLNNDTIELGRQRIKETGVTLTPNAILIQMGKEMGTRT